MKQLIIDRALDMEVGECIELTYTRKETARSFQSGLINALGKVPSMLRATICMGIHAPGSLINKTGKWAILIEKVDTYENATIMLKDGTIMNLLEYDNKRKADAET